MANKPFCECEAQFCPHQAAGCPNAPVGKADVMTFHLNLCNDCFKRHEEYSPKDVSWLRLGLHTASRGPYYHVTLAEYVPSIKEKGLLPMQTSNWVRRGDNERFGAGEIYAFEKPADAVRWAFKMQWHMKKPTAIVTFTSDANWEVDENDPLSQAGASGRWLKALTRIPPQNIKKVTPLTEDLTRQLVKGDEIKLAMITSDAELANNSHPADGNAGAPVLDGELEAPERANINAMREAIETQAEMEVGKPVEEKQEEVKAEEAAEAKGISVEKGTGGTQIIINIAGKKKQIAFSTKAAAAAFIKGASAKFGPKFKVVANEVITLKPGDKITWKLHQYGNESRQGTVISVLPSNADGLVIFDAKLEDLMGKEKGTEVWGYMGLVYIINGQFVKPLAPEKAEFIPAKTAAVTSGMSDIDNGAPTLKGGASEEELEELGKDIAEQGNLEEFHQKKTKNPTMQEHHKQRRLELKKKYDAMKGASEIAELSGGRYAQPREYVISVGSHWLGKDLNDNYILTPSLKAALKYDSVDDGREVKQVAAEIKNGIAAGKPVRIIPRASLPSIVSSDDSCLPGSKGHAGKYGEPCEWCGKTIKKEITDGKDYVIRAGQDKYIAVNPLRAVDLDHAYRFKNREEADKAATNLTYEGQPVKVIVLYDEDGSNRYYPADYTLPEWLELRKGWRNPKGDKEYWEKAQHSALGPNQAGKKNKEGSMKKYKVYTGPTLVKPVAEKLRKSGIPVSIEGTEHVHFQTDKPREEVLRTLRAPYQAEDGEAVGWSDRDITEMPSHTAGGMNFSPSNVPSQVVQEFYPELQHEIIDYPNVTNAPMVNPEISGDQHTLGTAPAEGIGEAVLSVNNENEAIPGAELLPGALEDAFDQLSIVSYVSTSPAGGALGRDGKPQVLEGAPLGINERQPYGIGQMDSFYQNYQEVPGAALSVISKKVAAAEEKEQFSLFLKKVMGEVAASFIAAFKCTTRMPLNKVPGVGEIQLAQVEQATNTSAFNIVNTGSRVKYLMDKLTDSEIQDAINDAYAQGAVWHENKEGGFVYEVFVRAETIDTESMILKYKFVTGTKEAEE